MAKLEKGRIIAAGQDAARKERATGKPVYPTNPVQGPIDYAALRKDSMRRFAKTLAYLAK